MATMKERISNVIAWVGFSSLVALALTFLIAFFDAAREKPELYADAIKCADLKDTNDEFLAFMYEEVNQDDCYTGWYASVWQYRGKKYGITEPYSSSAESLFAASTNIPNYSHRTGERLVESITPWALPLWLISVVLNYILFGSARLLPWKKAVISEEAS